MKIYTKDATIVFYRWKRSHRAILLVTFMISVAVVAQSSPAPDLGRAGKFVILSRAGIATTPGTLINGDIGISSITTGSIAGFELIMDASNIFSTSSLVSGKVYAANYTDPTPAYLTTAVSDMKTAYDNAAARTQPDYTDIYSGDVTGQTLTPGLYKWGTDVLISPGGVTISGTSRDVWIFQISGKLILAGGAIVTLSGGAQASNIFWQVAGEDITLGTYSDMKGIILCKTQILMSTGATLKGRAFADNIVSLDANAVAGPSEVTSIEADLAPKQFLLFQNNPNPFNPSTRIQYSLKKAAQVTLKVYNLIGREVATLVNSRQEAGSYTVPFNIDRGNLGFSTGVYFYRLEAGSFVSTKKLVLMK